jgi:hypothetical protein
VLLLFGGGFLYRSIYELRSIPTQALTTSTTETIETTSTARTGINVFNQTNTATQTSSYTFDQTGTFVFNNKNDGQTPDAWYLLYDTPRQLGNVVKLTFTNLSICMDQAQKARACTLGVGFSSGARVHIIGNQNGNTVTVGVLSRVSN